MSATRIVRGRRIIALGWLGMAACALGVGAGAGGNLLAGEAAPARVREIARGRELFLKEWMPNDPASHGGDGLGPVYNDTSCVACHNQGGAGGSGSASQNVEIFTASRAAQRVNRNGRQPTLHPGLRNGSSVVLHKFGTDPEYGRWRMRLLGLDSLADMAESPETEIRQVKEVLTQIDQSRRFVGRAVPGLASGSERNTPPLFGLGLIDALPNRVLTAAAQRHHPRFPDVHGRVSELKTGAIGRYGWKAQIYTLAEFVYTACAGEMGLEVPGHHQSMTPLDPDRVAKGLDLTRNECDDLVSYVRNLPRPIRRVPASEAEQVSIEAGETLFDHVGCAECHLPHIGNLQGIYSDLLLHEMGNELSDSGQYYGTTDPNSPNGPKGTEWRTPPLWGFRDSAPYLHDGRAKTLEDAVAYHSGEAAESARRFFKLIPSERLQVQAFLRTLSAPETATINR